MLNLPPPYGYKSPSGTHISIRTAPGFVYDRRVFDLMVDNGCPHSVATRAMSCLVHSNRYDCFVVLSRIGLEDFRADLHRLGHWVEIGPYRPYGTGARWNENDIEPGDAVEVLMLRSPVFSVAMIQPPDYANVTEKIPIEREWVRALVTKVSRERIQVALPGERRLDVYRGDRSSWRPV
jgi:hypothetical protein